jgi:hypothetical protein
LWASFPSAKFSSQIAELKNEVVETLPCKPALPQARVGLRDKKQICLAQNKEAST